MNTSKASDVAVVMVLALALCALLPAAETRPAPNSQPTSKPASTEPLATQPGQTIYKGKSRTKEWFDQTYKEFADKIAVVDGKFVDLGEGRAFSDIQPGYAGKKGDPYLYTGGTPRLGEILQPVGTILEVRDATSVLVHRAARKGDIAAGDLGNIELVYLVEGLNTSKMVDGKALDCKAMVYVGPWQYVDILGAKRTVCRFQIPRQLTKDEFLAVLRSGFELARYPTVACAQGTPDCFGVPDRVKIISGMRSVESYKWFVIKRSILP